MLKPGDKCVVLPYSFPLSGFVGSVVTLHSMSTRPTKGCSGCGNPRRWILENHPPSSATGVCQCILQKIDDDCDSGRQDIGSWDLCPWQPKEVRVSFESLLTVKHD